MVRMFIAAVVTTSLLSSAAFAQDVTTQSETADIDAASGHIHVAVSGVPLMRAVALLNAKLTTATVFARGTTGGQPITLLVRERSLEKVLNYIVAQQSDWLWYKPQTEENTYEIWDQENYRLQVLPKMVRAKTYRLKNIKAEEAYHAITPLMTPKLGRASFDPRSNKIFVSDLPAIHEQVAKLMEEIDVSFLTRVYHIKHADPKQMAEHIATLKSPSAPNPIVDERTKQVIVSDRLDVIRQMDLLMEVLDIRTPDEKKKQKHEGERARSIKKARNKRADPAKKRDIERGGDRIPQE